MLVRDVIGMVISIAALMLSTYTLWYVKSMDRPQSLIRRRPWLAKTVVIIAGVILFYLWGGLMILPV